MPVTKTVTWTKTRKVLPVWSPQVEAYDSTSTTSPRDSHGKLLLKHNAYYKSHYRNLGIRLGPQDSVGRFAAPAVYGNVNPNTDLGIAVLNRTRISANNKAYGKFVKLMRMGGGANLGVSFASGKQSLDMVSKRARSIANILRNRIPPGNVHIPANLYLETIFGWVPLMQDIADALMTYALHDPRQGSMNISASGISSERYRYVDNFSTVEDRGTWRARVTWSAKVRVANPNLWLANKLGFLNLAGIAWDVVPWSFVAGMFANVNQVLSAGTDFVGLTIPEQSVTTTYDWAGEVMKKQDGLWGWASYHNFIISRSLGSPLRPSLTTRVPALNTSLALMGAALMSQAWGSRQKDISIHHERYINGL